MFKVIYSFNVGKYVVLILNNPLPIRIYLKYLIEGVEYTPVTIYDMPQCIAIEAQ